MEFKRSTRVADLMLREIADLLRRRVKDPRLEAVTVTGVELTDDLRHARVFYCLKTEVEQRQGVATGLNKAKGFIRGELGKRLRLRYMPEIQFKYDESFDYGDKIDRLLKELHQDEGNQQ